MNALKGIGQAVIGLLAICASLLLLALFIYGLAWVAEQVMWLVFSVAQIAILVCVLILLPLAIFRGTRKAACFGLYGASVVFGVCTWLVGFSVSYFYWG